MKLAARMSRLGTETAFEALANVASDSVTEPTPEWITSVFPRAIPSPWEFTSLSPGFGKTR